MAPNFTFKISYSPSPIAKFYKKGVKFLCIWLLNLCKDFAQSLPISLGSGTESLRISLYCFMCLYYQVPDPIPGFQLNPWRKKSCSGLSSSMCAKNLLPVSPGTGFLWGVLLQPSQVCFSQCQEWQTWKFRRSAVILRKRMWAWVTQKLLTKRVFSYLFEKKSPIPPKNSSIRTNINYI